MNQQFIRELAQLCQEQGMGIVGTDIFVGEMPYADDSHSAGMQGLLLVNSPSPAPEKYIDTQYIIIDFWAVDAHTDGAYKKIQQVYNALHRREHYETANWYVYFSEATGNIEDMDRNTEGSKLLRLSVQFISRNLNTIS